MRTRLRHALAPLGLAIAAGGCSKGVDPPELPTAVRIQSGTFTMGAATRRVSGADVTIYDPCDDGRVTTGGKKTLACGAELMSEVIRHERTVAGFCVDQTEVTVDQYRHCVALGDCSKPKSTNAGNRGTGFVEDYYDQGTGTSFGNYPVRGVTHAQAEEYCRSSAVKGRLPTEVEWEFTATSRGARAEVWDDAGLTASLSSSCGDSEGSRGAVAYGTCTGNELLPVRAATKDSTAEGVRDLAGNAAEWVADEFDHLAYCDPRQPPGALTDLYRIDESSRRPLPEPRADLPNALLTDDTGACLVKPESGSTCATSDDCPDGETCKGSASNKKCSTPDRNKYTGGCDDVLERCLGVCTEAWSGESIAESERQESWKRLHCEAVGGDVARTVGSPNPGNCNPMSSCSLRDPNALEGCADYCTCLDADLPAPQGAPACLQRCVEDYATCAADCVQDGVQIACTKPDIANDPDTNRPRPWCAPLAGGDSSPHTRPEKFDADFLQGAFVVRGGNFQESASCGVRPSRRVYKTGSSPLVGFRCAYDPGSIRCP